MSGQARCEWYVFAVPELGNSRCTPPWSSSVYTQLHHAFAQPHQASLFCTHADIILSLTLRQVHSTNQSNYYLLQGNRGTKCGSSQGDLKKICSGRGRGRRPKLSWSQADRILRALKLAPRMTCCRRSLAQEALETEKVTWEYLRFLLCGDPTSRSVVLTGSALQRLDV